MKLLLAAVVILAANSSLAANSNSGSLGVGLDVLPAAYTFAANRVEFFPDLRLTSCTRTSCRWATGHTTDLVAYVEGWDLAVKRLEVDATRPAKGSDDELWFQRACLSIVALTLSGAERSEVQAIVDTISPKANAAPSDRREREVAGIRFYGTSVSSGPADGVRKSCGATTSAR